MGCSDKPPPEPMFRQLLITEVLLIINHYALRAVNDDAHLRFHPAIIDVLSAIKYVQLRTQHGVFYVELTWTCESSFCVLSAVFDRTSSCQPVCASCTVYTWPL